MTTGRGRPNSSAPPEIAPLHAFVERLANARLLANGLNWLAQEEDLVAIPGLDPDPYVVDNFDNSRGGGGTITQQTLRSSNCAYVRLGQVVGTDKVAAQARKMGMTTPMVPVVSMPLGTQEVLPIDMAAAFASIAADGVFNPPYYIDRVEDRDGAALAREVDLAPDRREISLRWLSGTFLTGITSSILMGVALFAALDGRQQLATPAEASANLQVDEDATTVSRGGRLLGEVLLVQLVLGRRPERRAAGHQVIHRRPQ